MIVAYFNAVVYKAIYSACLLNAVYSACYLMLFAALSNAVCLYNASFLPMIFIFMFCLGLLDIDIGTKYRLVAFKRPLIFYIF